MSSTLDKSMSSLSVKDTGTPPPLPTSAPPPPLPTTSAPTTSDTDLDTPLIQQQLLSCATLNNTDLLSTVLTEVTDHEKLAEVINTSKDFSGNTPLHLCCKNGSFEVMDTILDQEGVEVDPLNKDGESPLFFLVRYSKDEPEHGIFVIETLIDAGCDVSITNNEGLKAVDLVSRDNEELISILQSAEFVPDDEYALADFADDIDPDLINELEQQGDEGESGSESESE